MYFSLYGDTIVNIFIMSSSWLTVVMATSRYLAICHPFRAREIIGMSFAKGSICVVFLVCVLFNLPKFWSIKVDTMPCIGGWEVYFPMDGYMKQNAMFRNVYTWLYFLIGLLLPLLTLIYCNTFLLQTLYHSAKMRKKYSNPNASAESKHQITLTLIIIIIMYILLVLPAEVINFFKDYIKEEHRLTDCFNLGLAIVNCLQAINFAFNFVLYCAINVHFRRTMLEVSLCFCPRNWKGKTDLSSESVTPSSSGLSRQTALSEV